MEISWEGGIQKKLSVFGSKFLEMGHLGNLELVQEYGSVVGVQFGFQPSGQVLLSLIWPLWLLLLLIYNLFLQNQSVSPEMTATGARRSLYKRSPSGRHRNAHHTIDWCSYRQLLILRRFVNWDFAPGCLELSSPKNQGVSLSSVLASCSSVWVSFWCPILDGTIGRRALEEPFLCLRTAHFPIVFLPSSVHALRLVMALRETGSCVENLPVDEAGECCFWLFVSTYKGLFW